MGGLVPCVLVAGAAAALVACPGGADGGDTTPRPPICELIPTQPEHAIGWNGGGLEGGVDCFLKVVVDDQTNVRVGEPVDKGANDFLQCGAGSHLATLEPLKNLQAQGMADKHALYYLHVPKGKAVCASRIVGAVCGCNPTPR